MLTGLKVLPLACQCVFCRPEHDVKEQSHKLNFDGFKMQQ